MKISPSAACGRGCAGRAALWRCRSAGAALKPLIRSAFDANHRSGHARNAVGDGHVQPDVSVLRDGDTAATHSTIRLAPQRGKLLRGSASAVPSGSQWGRVNSRSIRSRKVSVVLTTYGFETPLRYSAAPSQSQSRKPAFEDVQ